MRRITALLAASYIPVANAPQVSMAVCPRIWPDVMTRLEIRRLAVAVGFPAAVAGTMAEIAWRESRGHARAIGRGRRDESYGLFQINFHGRLGRRLQEFRLERKEDLLRPERNAMVALELYRKAGLRPWEKE